jgi:hypothetical protein
MEMNFKIFQSILIIEWPSEPLLRQLSVGVYPSSVDLFCPILSYFHTVGTHVATHVVFGIGSEMQRHHGGNWQTHRQKPV